MLALVYLLGPDPPIAYRVGSSISIEAIRPMKSVKLSDGLHEFHRTENIQVMAIDPSSTACGFAMFKRDGALSCFGVVKGSKSTQAIWRAVSMAETLALIESTASPETVVIELPDYHVARRLQQKRSAAGLAIYGLAVGIVFQTLLLGRTREYGKEHGIIPVTPDWTHGDSKIRRTNRVAAEFSRYREFAEKGLDRGQDAADAIGLGLWWRGEQQRARILEGATPV